MHVTLKIEFSLLFVIIMANSHSYAQICTAKILQNDTAICLGASLPLTVSINNSTEFCNIHSLSNALQNGLLGWYPFCGNTNDISSNANNGFPTGPLTYTTDRYNNATTAIRFSGNGESVRTNKIVKTTVNSFSYVVWVNTQNNVTLPLQTTDPSSGFSVDLATPCVIHATHGYNWNLNNKHTGAGLYVAANGVFIVEHAALIVATPLSWSGSLIGWHCVAVVYDNHLPKLYVDGNFIKNGLETPYIVHPSMACDSFHTKGTYPYITCGFGKGFHPGTVSVPFNNFKGDIDDIKIYNRALTQDEISELYENDKFNIRWSTGDTGRTITVNPFQDASYSVMITNSLKSCGDTVHIAVLKKPIAAFRVTPSPNPVSNSRIGFNNLSLNTSAWSWIFGDGVGSSADFDPVYIYKDTGSYTVRLVASNSNNCTDTTYQTIDVSGSKKVYIPTAFSPNGDGVNDNFEIYGIGLQSVDMTIYSRWGEIVFKKTAFTPSWNGINQKNGKNCEQGIFVYVIKTADISGEIHLYRGTVLLIR